MRNPVLLPMRDAIVGEQKTITDVWADYFAALGQSATRASVMEGEKELTGQSAAIASTAIPLQTVYQALYRVSYYAEITQAASSSSSLTVTIGWTRASKSFTESGTAITGNTTTTQQNGTLFVSVDGGSEITYSTAYSSSGATPMEYRLELKAERIG